MRLVIDISGAFPECVFDDAVRGVLAEMQLPGTAVVILQRGADAAEVQYWCATCSALGHEYTSGYGVRWLT